MGENANNGDTTENQAAETGAGLVPELNTVTLQSFEGQAYYAKKAAYLKTVVKALQASIDRITKTGFGIARSQLQCDDNVEKDFLYWRDTVLVDNQVLEVFVSYTAGDFETCAIAERALNRTLKWEETPSNYLGYFKGNLVATVQKKQPHVK